MQHITIASVDGSIRFKLDDQEASTDDTHNKVFARLPRRCAVVVVVSR